MNLSGEGGGAGGLKVLGVQGGGGGVTGLLHLVVGGVQIGVWEAWGL